MESAQNHTPSKEKRKVLVVVGTRPEAIKVFPIVREMMKSERILPIVVSTGQHPRIVREIFNVVGLEVDVDLRVGEPDISLNRLFSRIMRRFEEYFVSEFGRPVGPGPERDLAEMPVACLVHGDTSSAAAAAMASFHLQIPVAHIEAGLRTADVRTPFPEELNRQIISRIAAFHLAPTIQNLENLVRERVPAERVFVTGNTAIDALLIAAEHNGIAALPELEHLAENPEIPVVVVTAHRRENWGRGLEQIAAAISELAQRFPDVRFVVPMHPNPRVKQALHPRLHPHTNITLMAPMDYVPFAGLLKRATLVITDSGGIQEEAPALDVPVLVLRETTERQEGVDTGTLKLVGTDTAKIVEMASELLTDPVMREQIAAKPNPYGDGRASERIVAAMEHVAFDGPVPSPFGPGFNRLAVLRAGGFDEDPHRSLRGVVDEAHVVTPKSAEVVEDVLRN